MTILVTVQLAGLLLTKLANHGKILRKHFISKAGRNPTIIFVHINIVSQRKTIKQHFLYRG